tara:strand:- start:3421 stop:3765 length:345 start_codon:yes stop_codon:yes gene_type:complete
MSTQIFKNIIPKDILLNFLEKTAKKKGNSYVFSKVEFKTAQFNNLIIPFCESLKEYYHKSKLIYIERKMNYKNFITVIRQLCKSLHLPFSSKIIYDKSNYEIIYTIFTEFGKTQ